MKNIFLLSLVGGFIFSIGDMAHIAFKIASYSSEAYIPYAFFNIPWWVPLEFFLAGLILLKTYPIRKKLFKLESKKRNFYDPLVSFSFSFIIYLLSSFIPEDYFIYKILILFSILLSQLFILKINGFNSWLELIWIGLNGCGFEFILGKLGIFQYYPSGSVFFTIPIWLWLLYMSVAATIRTAHEAFHNELI
jgi:hypothetical protein